MSTEEAVRSRRFGGRNRRQEPALSSPAPETPVEVGLALRSARERAGTSLEELREWLSIPIFDLFALEEGALDRLPSLDGAVVAVARLAQALRLDPEPLVGVLRRSYPISGPARGQSALFTPVSALGSAARLLRPIETLADRVPTGLSAGTEALLHSAAVGENDFVGSIVSAMRATAPRSPSLPAPLAGSSASAKDEHGSVASDSVDGAEVDPDPVEVIEVVDLEEADNQPLGEQVTELSVAEASVSDTDFAEDRVGAQPSEPEDPPRLRLPTPSSIGGARLFEAAPLPVRLVNETLARLGVGDRQRARVNRAASALVGLAQRAKSEWSDSRRGRR